MGQEDSRPQLSHKASPRNITYTLPQAHNRNKQASTRVQCEGVLKLQATPFKNCIEIQTETEVLFLQAVELTLKQLLEGRLNTNKLFLVEDIDRLIEGVTFALAHLQQKGVTYKDIDPQNIFYDNGSFKLLPNQLICLNSYQKLRQGSPVLPSPELIIALRCGEEDVTEDDILQKSNVFTFGMLLLEVCTLLPSEQCYDSQNYDILDAVINERVLLVEEYYGERIAKIVANMLDYDYTERMNLKDLSIWVNRQLQASKATSSSEQQHPLSLPAQDQTTHSVLASKVQRSEGKTEKSKSRLTKNNSVYMNLHKQEGREERNKIYINDSSRQDEPPPRTFPRQLSRETLQPPNRPYRNEQPEKQNFDRFLCNQSLNESDTYKLNESLPLKDTRYPEQRLNHPYQLNEDYKIAHAPSKKENAYERSLIDRDTVTKRIAKEPARPFRNQEEGQKGPLKEIGNQYYPNIDQILKSKPQLPRGEVRNDLIKGPVGENGSLTRIKQEIMKSKKLIEQFKRTQART